MHMNDLVLNAKPSKHLPGMMAGFNIISFSHKSGCQTYHLTEASVQSVWAQYSGLWYSYPGGNFDTLHQK